MYIYLIRHGQTDWNLQGKVQGTTDIPLNNTGIEQAENASNLFKGRTLDALITSPLQRTIDTGKRITSQAIVKEHRIDPRIIEKCFGICEGMDIAQRRSQYPEGHAPGEESYKIVKKRMAEAIRSYAKEYTGDIVIVSHGSAMAALLKALEPSFESSFLRFENVSLTIFDQNLHLLAYNLIGREALDWMNDHPCTDTHTNL